MGFDFFTETEEEKEYAVFKVQQHYKKVEHMNRMYLQFLTEMILCDKIQIKDMPFELRTSNTGFYVAAFRVSRNISSERFMDDVMLLYGDLQKNFDDKKSFMKMLLSELDHYDFQGVEEFETVKTDITKELLQKLSFS